VPLAEGQAPISVPASPPKQQGSVVMAGPRPSSAHGRRAPSPQLALEIRAQHARFPKLAWTVPSQRRLPAFVLRVPPSRAWFHGRAAMVPRLADSPVRRVTKEARAIEPERGVTTPVRPGPVLPHHRR
jgi:hypothetical protein